MTLIYPLHISIQNYKQRCTLKGSWTLKLNYFISAPEWIELKNIKYKIRNLARDCMRFADFVAPVATSNRNHRQLGQDDGTPDSCSNFLGALHSQSNVTIWVTNGLNIHGYFTNNTITNTVIFEVMQNSSYHKHCELWKILWLSPKCILAHWTVWLSLKQFYANEIRRSQVKLNPQA